MKDIEVSVIKIRRAFVISTEFGSFTRTTAEAPKVFPLFMASRRLYCRPIPCIAPFHVFPPAAKIS